MPEFEVKCIVRSGLDETRIVHAQSEEEAALQVLAGGATPMQIRRLGRGWLERLNRPLKDAKRIGLLDLALFAQQLSEMLQAGITIEQSLVLQARDNGNKAVRSLAERLVLKVRGGSAFSQALADEESIPGFFSGLVRGSERGGNLSEGLGYLGDYLARQEATRSRIIAALTYPAIVVVTSIFAFAFVLVAVIPEFSPLFAGEESRLPMVTRMVLWLSDLVVGRWFSVTVIAIVGAVSFTAAY